MLWEKRRNKNQIEKTKRSWRSKLLGQEWVEKVEGSKKIISMSSLFFLECRIASYSKRTSWINCSKEKQKLYVSRGRENYQRRYRKIKWSSIQTKTVIEKDERCWRS